MVGIEWLSPSGLGSRNTTYVRVESLCGGAIELVERCDALLWRARRAVGRRLLRRGTHAELARALLAPPQGSPLGHGASAAGAAKRGGSGSGGSGSGGSGSGGAKSARASAPQLAKVSSKGESKSSSPAGRRLAGAKKEEKKRKRAAAAAAAGSGVSPRTGVSASAANASTLVRDMIRELFELEYTGPGTQLSGCVLSAADDAGLDSAARFM